MPDVGGVAADHLRSYIERIERIREEKKALADDEKEIFAEAKGTGFDVKAMRTVLKERGIDKAEYQEQQYMTYLYRQALGMPDFDDTELGQAADEAAESASNVVPMGERF
ncbi:MAG: GapR family DNA-binding domain-containing protein [Sneathiella sp.]